MALPCMLHPKDQRLMESPKAHRWSDAIQALIDVRCTMRYLAV